MNSLEFEKSDTFVPSFSNQINTIHDYLTNLSESEIIDLIEKNQKFPFFLEWMNYYFWLFRRESKIQNFFNLKNFPNSFILQYIYYSFGKWLSLGNNPDNFFMEISSLFNKTKCLQILVEEELIDKDANLALSFISNLDEKYLVQYFDNSGSTLKITDFFLNLFNEIDDEVIKTFFIKNPELYAFILNLFNTNQDISGKNKDKVKKFQLKFQSDLEMLTQIFDIKDYVFLNFNIEDEKLKEYNKRNFKRISYIINKLKKMENIDDGIQILYRHYVIIERMEKDMIRQILKDEFIAVLFSSKT